MPVYRLTPEEIRALLGQGLITFDQRTIQARQRDEQRKREAGPLQSEQEEDGDESDS